MSKSATETTFRLPGAETLNHAVKLAITEDRPIMLDYWTGSIEKSVVIGIKGDTNNKDEPPEKILVRSTDEYTSPITKIFNVGSDFIIVTENSIYIVDKDIPKKRFTTN